MIRKRYLIFGILTLVFVLAGCSRYDADQAEQEPPLGTPPVVTISGPTAVTEPDSLHVQAHIVPGEFEFADYSFGCSGTGEVIQSRITRLQSDRIDLAATFYFPVRGSYWVWVHVWDTEEQTDTDSLHVTVQ